MKKILEKNINFYIEILTKSFYNTFMFLRRIRNIDFRVILKEETR